MPFRDLSEIYESETLAKLTKAYNLALPQLKSYDFGPGVLATLILELFHRNDTAEAEELARVALERLRFDPTGAK